VYFGGVFLYFDISILAWSWTPMAFSKGQLPVAGAIRVGIGSDIAGLPIPSH
jgi:hypothetical protein